MGELAETMEEKLTAIPIQAPVSPSAQFLASIQSAASDVSVDVDKMERLYTMYEKVKADEARVAYNTAMSLVQAQSPVINKTHWNEHTKSWYAKVEDVIRQIKPIAAKNGFSLSLYPATESPDGFVKVCIDVSHSAGETRTFTYDSPIDDKGSQGNVNKTPTHGRASAMTYGERYLICLVFCLEVAFIGQDNDGNGPGSQGVELITNDQANEIHATVVENNLGIEWLGEWLSSWNNDHEEIGKIPLVRFQKVMDYIKKKIGTMSGYPQEQFDANFPKWEEAILAGKQTSERVIGIVEAKGALTDEMKQQLKRVEINNADS